MMLRVRSNEKTRDLVPSWEFLRRAMFASVLIGTLWCNLGVACPQVDHQHDSPGVKPPRIFLNKSRKIVDFQLKRLDNQRLLMVPRLSDDPKYLPVHEAILKREGIASGDREAALQAIVTINQSDPVSELLAVLKSLNRDERRDGRLVHQLTRILLAQPQDVLAGNQQTFETLIQSETPRFRQIGFAGLLETGTAQSLQLVDQLGATSPDHFAALLAAIPSVENLPARNQTRPLILKGMGSDEPDEVRRNAVRALQFVTEKPAENFLAAAKLIPSPALRRTAIKTLMTIPRPQRNPKVAQQIAEQLVQYAESTPPAARTTDEFLEAMQLTNQLLGLLDRSKAASLQKRLDAVAVRVILIHTVEEEMRYDVPWFAVEAGREFQVVLKNEDLMPHNLVFTMPDKLQDVALAGAAAGPQLGPSGKQYVPDSPDVIAATEMVPSEGQARLTFQAPQTPGEYPFVCTFPGHWMRMYGVMVVVEDLAEFQRHPIDPKDPIGSNRAFVKAWTVADFQNELKTGLRGRSTSIGKKIFLEATCATCHIVRGEGKSVGPDLTDVWSRWKGDATGVMREILEPSHRIDSKYVVRKIMTLDGRVISGLVLSEDKQQLSILPNPESPEPTVVLQENVDEMINSSVSLMPKALLDRFSQDEILELLAYLKEADPGQSGQPAPKADQR